MTDKHITIPIAFREPVDVYSIILGRASKRGMTVGQYCRERARIDALRKR